MSISLRAILVACLVAGIAAGCHFSQSAATQPSQNIVPSADHDAVESFFAAIRAGDAVGLSRAVTPGHPNGIGGRTWDAWIRDYRNVYISRYQFHIVQREPSGDRSAMRVVLSSGEELTFYLLPVGSEYRISGIDGGPNPTTRP